jgi:hypothetical protein
MSIIETSTCLHRHINININIASPLKLCKSFPRFLHGLSYDKIRSKVLRLMEESQTAGSLISAPSDILDLLSSTGSRISLINRVTTAVEIVETQPNLEIPVFVPPDVRRVL